MQIKLLQTFADQAVIAFESVRLFSSCKSGRRIDEFAPAEIELNSPSINLSAIGLKRRTVQP
jgi:hypothetical protein